eukprot:scaffold40876_cov29-Tisochrysis_lutea.AAC.2
MAVAVDDPPTAAFDAVSNAGRVIRALTNRLAKIAPPRPRIVCILSTTTHIKAADGPAALSARKSVPAPSEPKKMHDRSSAGSARDWRGPAISSRREAAAAVAAQTRQMNASALPLGTGDTLSSQLAPAQAVAAMAAPTDGTTS